MRRVSRRLGATVAVLVSASFLPLTPAHAVVAPVGQGFTVSPADLAYILRQIKVAEAHVANTTSATGPCGALIGPGPNQLASPLLSLGLRTVDGSCNNLQPGQERFGSADQVFPRLGSKAFRPAESRPADFFGPGSPAGPATSYAQKSGSVYDTEPRVISNLIVDQTSTNPAAVAAAGFPVRAQGGTPVVPCTTEPTSTTPGSPAGCVPAHQTLFIPNVTTDVGLSPPYNSLFTLFGQFFDHGVDQTVKGGGTVFVPLKADDPLIPGADHVLGTNCSDPDPAARSAACADDLPASKRFMVLTRAQNQPGPDGVLGTADDIQDAKNTDSPWVDQSQTYTSHPSHQVFLREYVNNPAGKPVSTGRLLGGPAGPTAGGMATWTTTKAQAATLLGLKLVDTDVTDIPMLAADPYGKFIPGPARGLPQYVTKYRGLVEGDIANPVLVPTRRAVVDGETVLGSPIVTSATAAFTQDDVRSLISGAGIPDGTTIVSVDSPTQVTTTASSTSSATGVTVAVDPGTVHFDTPFLTDIAHNADPSPVDTDHNPATPPVAPIPDADTVASADFASQPPGTYDDEMLNAHFIAGDGRVNENIGLTTIHQVFHSEHDRLVGDIEKTLTEDTSPSGVAALQEWKLAAGAGGWNGERIFQAARFVTEMEYQHLVFEEFARKVQPGINPFQPFAFTQTELNPAIKAEFAHAVYRFGHSMLTETISRRNEDLPGPDTVFGTSDDIRGSTNDISLLNGFLNPPEYTNGGPAGSLTSEQAAGSVVMGMSDQVGNELDEFVTGTLRNNLLGLPLDLATINMARARSEGIPRLNVLRRELNALTNDAQLKPYSNWIDLGQNLKHPESLVNFVAAYGQHPTILTNAGPDATLGTSDDGPATLASRRNAARKIVSPDSLAGDVAPADAADFMNSVGAWANSGTTSITGLDDVDLWVGGLAEKTNLFGGLLGSTFNYVFESQLTDLQNGDRFYYLARTPGMNLRTQLEGNSFAELIQRNTNAHSLKADAFATADCKFELKNLDGTVAGFNRDGNTVANDPTTECNETALLIRMPDGTIKYRERNTVNPSGINGQSVYNGTAGVDRIYGGNDNDTFWGGAQNDIIDGGGGADVVLGGDGNDIITDFAGDDILKGGPGNDAIDAGPGLDIVIPGDGDDFTNGGANTNVTFAGAGDDKVIGGQGPDEVFGDSGNDWEEGGDQPDLLIGDSSNLFFLDTSQRPGHDIMIGQGGDDDYDMEGGDDIGVAGPGIEKVAGGSGYDWEIGLGDPQPQDADLALPIAPAGILQIGVRDRFNEAEALSGWKLDDTLRGDDIVPAARGGAGFIGCDVLDQSGLDRIAGLDPLVRPLDTPLATVVAASASNYCPLLSGTNVWGAGNILLGGGGSDLMEGRGANDVIDGDRYLSVRLSVRTNAADPNSEVGSAVVTNTGQTAMASQYLRDGAGNLTGPTLQQAVFAGDVDPGNIVAVREILSDSTGTDTALFSGPRSNYTIVPTAATATELAKLTVTQTGLNVVGQKASDGIDTVRNVELLKFSDQTLLVQTPVAPTGVSATTTPSTTSTAGSAVVSWIAPPAVPGSPTTSFNVVTSTGGVVVRTTPFGRLATSGTITNLVAGTPYTFQVQAVNQFGAGALSAPSNQVTPLAVPGAPTTVVAVRGNASASLSWTAPALTGGSLITGYTVTVRTGATVVTGPTVVVTDTTATVTGLTNGTAYTFQVRAVNAQGTGAPGTSNTVTPATVPDAPTVGAATGVNSATTAGSATLSWIPGFNGGSAITSYQIVATPSTGPVVTRIGIAATATSGTVTGLVNGMAYTLQVRAVNVIGTGPLSGASNAVTPTGVPGTPTGVLATRGIASVGLSWNAPSDGGSPITGYMVQVRVGTTVVRTVPLTGAGTSTTIGQLTNGTAYNFRVAAVNANGTGAFSAASNTVTPASAPTAAPTNVSGVSGAAGGARTVTVTWTGVTAANNGGTAITNYRVTAYDGADVVIQRLLTATAATSITLTFNLVGPYTFDVAAVNAVGDGPISARSVPPTQAL